MKLSKYEEIVNRAKNTYNDRDYLAGFIYGVIDIAVFDDELTTEEFKALLNVSYSNE